MGSSFEIIESNQEIKQHNLNSKLDNIKSKYIKNNSEEYKSKAIT